MGERDKEKENEIEVKFENLRDRGSKREGAESKKERKRGKIKERKK